MMVGPGVGVGWKWVYSSWLYLRVCDSDTGDRDRDSDDQAAVPVRGDPGDCCPFARSSCALGPSHGACVGTLPPQWVPRAEVQAGGWLDEGRSR